MIMKIANMEIDRGRINDFDILKTMGDPFTLADQNDEYIAATDIDERN